MESSKTTPKKRKPNPSIVCLGYGENIAAGVRWLLGDDFKRLRHAEKIGRAHDLLLQGLEISDIINTLLKEYAISQRRAYEFINYAKAIHQAVFFNSLANKSKVYISRKLNIVDRLIKEGKDAEALGILDKIGQSGGLSKAIDKKQEGKILAVSALVEKIL